MLINIIEHKYTILAKIQYININMQLNILFKTVFIAYYLIVLFLINNRSIAFYFFYCF